MPAREAVSSAPARALTHATRPAARLGATLFCAITALLPQAHGSVPDVGPFFEPGFPFFQTPVDLRVHPKHPEDPGNLVIRGILLPLADGHCAIFDQELLRCAGLWITPAGQPPVTLKSMAQISYADPRHKAGTDHPKPAAPLQLEVGMHPGIASSLDALFKDPRKPGPEGELGRGPLPEAVARFQGIEDAGTTAILDYTCGTAAIREWLDAKSEGADSTVLQHFEAAPHAQPIFIAIGAAPQAAWNVTTPNAATATPTAANLKPLAVATNLPACRLQVREGELVAELPPATTPQRVTIAISTAAVPLHPGPTPAAPVAPKAPRWSPKIITKASLNAGTRNGLIFDRLELPEENPWKRRVRPADIAFLSPSQAAVVTYDGDVWIVDNLADADLPAVTWERFASGLSEPLSIANVGGVLQVGTKNGIVRLHDRAHSGQADFYENFSDLVLQSQSTRAFALDMAVARDGTTYFAQGGIAAGGKGTEYSGGIARISPNGRSVSLFAAHAREPYVAVNPVTGVVTATDQQGNFIPSSVCYYVREGDNYGFGDEHPAKLTLPLVWVPYSEDNSSASELWLSGQKLGPFDGKLVHLSYGTGHLFLISPDFDAPIPQGAVIPVGIDTDIPLLHARNNPDGSAIFLCGFQVYDSRTKTNWAMGRLRLEPEPPTSAIAARSCPNGVILTFAAPLNPASVTSDKVFATLWNYRRSKAYGSGRYKLNGEEGVDPIPVGDTVLSADGKSVFIHLPTLQPVDNLEVTHNFLLASGAKAEGVVYFTIHQAHPIDLAKAGFPKIDLSKNVAVIRTRQEAAPTVEAGKALYQNIGCIACHSTDGTPAGKTGPTWKGLYGAEVRFTDGTKCVADDAYIRESILDPAKKIVAGFQPGMASYRGVLTDAQIDSLILFIKSLK